MRAYRDKLFDITVKLDLEQYDELTKEEKEFIQLKSNGDYDDFYDVYEDINKRYDEKLAGTAIHRLEAFHEYMNPDEYPAAHQLFLCEKLEQLERRELRMLLISFAPGMAKAKPKRSIVRTPSGSCAMEDLSIGDRVITLEGKTSKVTAKTVPHKEPCYNITLQDKTVLKCGGTHPWPTSDGRLEAKDLVVGQEILRPRIYDVASSSSLSDSSISDIVEGICDVKYRGGIPDEIFALSNASLREKFVPQFLRHRMRKYERSDTANLTYRRTVGHPSRKLMNDFLSIMYRLGVRDVCVRIAGTQPNITLGEKAYRDLFSYKKRTSLPDNSSRTKAEFMVAGMLIGDGSTPIKSACMFTNGTPEVISLFMDMCNTFIVDDFRIDLTRDTCVTVCGHASGLGQWCEDAGLLGKKFDTKTVPDWVYDGDADKILAFLTGLMLTDGTIYKRKPNKGRTVFSVKANISHANKKLVEQEVELFNLVGIRATVVKRYSSYKGESYIFWSAVLKNKKAITDFFTRAFVVGYKQERFLEYVKEGFLPKYKSEDHAGCKITDIEVTPDEDMMCITVQDGTYLLESGHATHNSSYASRSFIQWYIGRHPNEHVLSAGYSLNFVVNEFSKRNRAVIKSERYLDIFPDVMLDEDYTAATLWAIDKYGGRYNIRSSGADTSGIRANVIALDDVTGGAKSAASAGDRAKIWRWVTADVFPRRLPNAIFLNIGTRWHSEDTLGHLEKLIREDPDSLPSPAEVINIPASGGPNNPFADEGHYVWEEFYGKKHFETQKTLMSAGTWMSTYEGVPMDEQGTYFSDDDIHYYKEKAEQDYFTTLSIDTAQKSGSNSNRTAITVWDKGKVGPHYLVDAWAGREPLIQIVKRITNLCEKHRVNKVLIEDAAMGAQILENYKTAIPAPVTAVNAVSKGSKEFVFDAYAVPMIVDGSLAFPKHEPFSTDVIGELSLFPDGELDDYVDSVSQYAEETRHGRKYGSKKLNISQ
jgi:predicted phage terminase large subunit-like protein